MIIYFNLELIPDYRLGTLAVLAEVLPAGPRHVELQVLSLGFNSTDRLSSGAADPREFDPAPGGASPLERDDSPLPRSRSAFHKTP